MTSSLKRYRMGAAIDSYIKYILDIHYMYNVNLHSFFFSINQAALFNIFLTLVLLKFLNMVRKFATNLGS